MNDGTARDLDPSRRLVRDRRVLFNLAGRERSAVLTERPRPDLIARSRPPS